MEREVGFTRDTRKNGIAGWRVRLRCKGKQVGNKFFSDKIFGSSENALTMARQYRDEIALQNDVATTKHINAPLFMTRQKLGISQKDAAALLEIAPLTYSRWELEKGKCPTVIPSLLEFVHQHGKSVTPILPTDLKDLRAKGNLNKTKMAKMLGYRYDTYSRWESGKTVPSRWVMTFFSAINSGLYSIDHG